MLGAFYFIPFDFQTVTKFATIIFYNCVKCINIVYTFVKQNKQTHTQNDNFRNQNF